MTRKASNNSLSIEKITSSIKNSLTNYGKKESSDSKVIGSNSTKNSVKFKYKSDPRVQLNINPTNWLGHSNEERDPKRLCYVTGMTNGKQNNEYIFLSGIYARNGIVFDLTPKIDYSQNIEYAKTNIPHFNGTLFNYKNTPSPTINLTGHFINGNIDEVSYNIQIIHFLKSISLSDFGTKDEHQGLPPPFLYLNGFGVTNFRNLRVLVKSFSISYPDNVDYIKSFLNMDSLVCYSYNPIDLARTTKTYIFDESFVIDGKSISDVEVQVDEPSELQKFVSNGGERNQLFKNITASTWNGDNTECTVEVLLPVKFDISIQLEVLTNVEEQTEFSLRKFKRGDYIKQGYGSKYNPAKSSGYMKYKENGEAKSKWDASVKDLSKNISKKIKSLI